MTKAIVSKSRTIFSCIFICFLWPPLVAQESVAPTISNNELVDRIIRQNSSSTELIIKLSDMEFTDRASLSGLSIRGVIEFSNCHFSGGFEAIYGEYGSFVFANCTFSEMDLGDSVAGIYKSACRIESSDFSGDINFDECEFGAGVSLIDCNIKKSLYFVACKVIIPEPPDEDKVIVEPYRRSPGLNIQGVNITESMHCTYQTELNGPLRILSSRIGQDCNLSDLRVTESLYNSLTISNTHIGSKLTVIGVDLSGNVEFIDSSCRVYADAQYLDGKIEDEMSYGGVFTRGQFKYENFGLDAPIGPEYRLGWLRSNEPSFFSLDEYIRLAEIYQSRGNLSDKQTILVQMHWDTLRFRDLGLLVSGWYYAYGHLAGFGYEPLRLLFVAIAIVVCGCIVFQRNRKFMVPIEAAVERSDVELLSVGKKSPVDVDDDKLFNAGYPRLHPFAYSVDLLLPVINLRQSKYWFPGSACQLLRWYAYFHILMGWILSSVLILAIVDMFNKNI